MKNEEFEYGKGRRSGLDSFSLNRYWQKGYGIDRFSPAYITNCYSTAPQAVFKIISFSKGDGSAKAMLEYVVFRQGKKVEIKDLDNFDNMIKDADGNYYEASAQEFYTESGEVLSGKNDISELHEAWSAEFRKKGSGRGEQRHLTHMLLSANVEPHQRNANSVFAAAQKTLWEEFGRFGFEYIYVLHTDTEQPHVHCILKNNNNRTKRKLRLDRHDLLRIRTEFGTQLTDRGLKKHIATLRRDRPATLLRVQDVISKIKKQKKLIKDTVNQSDFYKRPSRWSAQLNKQVKQHDYSELSISFDSSNENQIKIIANKRGAHVEKLLKRLAFKLDSKSFNVCIDDTASINIHDIDNLSIEQRKSAALDFKKMADNALLKQNQKLIKKTKDVLPQYQSLLIRANRSIAWIKKNKLLTSTQKQATIKELAEVKNKLLNNYDIDNMRDVHLLISGRIGSSAAKEMLHIEKHKLNAKEFLKRYLSLQAYVDKQKEELQEKIKTYKKTGDKDMVVALKGLETAKGKRKYIKAQKRITKQVLDKRLTEKSNPAPDF